MTFSVPGPKLSGISIALRVVYISSAGPEEHKHGVFKKIGLEVAQQLRMIAAPVEDLG